MTDTDPKIKTEEEGAAVEPADEVPVAESAADAADAAVKQEDGHDGEAEAEPCTSSEAPAAGTKRPHAESVLNLGYKSFDTSKKAHEYFKGLLSSAPMGQDLNEYEHRVLLDLLAQGHPSAQSKIGCGLRAFQVRSYQGTDSKAFFAVRKDGTAEDFSYMKCLSALYPGEINMQQRRGRPESHGPGGGGGGGRGRGGGGGGRGGGGRGGGRGSRGGRGRGRR